MQTAQNNLTPKSKELSIPVAAFHGLNLNSADLFIQQRTKKVMS